LLDPDNDTPIGLTQENSPDHPSITGQELKNAGSCAFGLFAL